MYYKIATSYARNAIDRFCAPRRLFLSRSTIVKGTVPLADLIDMKGRDGMKIRGLICAVMVLAGSPLAFADPWGYEATTSISSGLIDRGEALATLNNEASFTVARALQFGEVYGSLYRISPIGGEASAFDEEVDYTVGFAFEKSGVAFDASANYLTFPGSNEDASLELATEIGFDYEFSPSLAAFYDVDAEIFGLEAAIGPSYESGDWVLTGVLRAGFVSSDDADYSYGGVEGIAAKALSDHFSLEGFARIEAADAENFVSDVRNGAVIETKNSDAILGLRIIIEG